MSEFVENRVACCRLLPETRARANMPAQLAGMNRLGRTFREMRKELELE